MAKVKQADVKVKVSTPGYKLSLSEKEAQTLTLILAHVGGDPTFSARREAQNIYDALRGAELEYDTSPDRHLIDGSIRFRSR